MQKKEEPFANGTVSFATEGTLNTTLQEKLDPLLVSNPSLKKNYNKIIRNLEKTERHARHQAIKHGVFVGRSNFQNEEEFLSQTTTWEQEIALTFASKFDKESTSFMFDFKKALLEARAPEQSYWVPIPPLQQPNKLKSLEAQINRFKSALQSLQQEKYNIETTMQTLSEIAQGIPMRPMWWLKAKSLLVCFGFSAGELILNYERFKIAMSGMQNYTYMVGAAIIVGLITWISHFLGKEFRLYDDNNPSGEKAKNWFIVTCFFVLALVWGVISILCLSTQDYLMILLNAALIISSVLCTYHATNPFEKQIVKYYEKEKKRDQLKIEIDELEKEIHLLEIEKEYCESGLEPEKANYTLTEQEVAIVENAKMQIYSNAEIRYEKSILEFRNSIQKQRLEKNLPPIKHWGIDNKENIPRLRVFIKNFNL